MAISVVTFTINCSTDHWAYQTSQNYSRYGAPALALLGPCQITSSPVRLPFVLPSREPTLANGLAMELWFRTGSTHPLSEAYHRCCCTSPGVLINDTHFCVFLFLAFIPFNPCLISLSLSIFCSSFSSCAPYFDMSLYVAS